MKIECHDHTVKEVLQSDYYEIPRFQRPYSWDKDNLEDFWKDVFKSNKNDYFIGSIVTYKINDSRAVVDGQQRLTTITILLSIIRNEFDGIGFPNKADGIHRLIERFDLENTARFVLATETSYPYLQFAIQNRTPDHARAAKGEEDELLKFAYAFLADKVKGDIDQARQNGSSSDTAIRTRIHNKLENLRDTVLALKLILVQLDNEDDAYLVFETLNTRGKDLTTSDLLKNHMARLLRASNAKGDSFKVKWSTVTDNVKSIQLADVTLDDFIYHYWLAKNDFTKARGMFRVIKESVATNALAGKALDELVKYSEIYRNLFRTNLRPWRNDELRIRASVEAIISHFRVRQPLPLMLTGLSKHADRSLSKSELERLLSAIELFTFTHTGLMAARSSGGILQMYSMHARELSRSNSTTRRENTIDDLIAKLRDRLPDKSSFVERFSSLRYSDRHLADKRLVQYALRKLMEYIAPSISVNATSMSIEHIASQSDNVFNPECIASIGNLWYLDASFNTSLGNLKVAKKLAAYRKASTPSDDVLRDATDWDSSMIERRSKFLGETMWSIVNTAVS